MQSDASLSLVILILWTAPSQLKVWLNKIIYFYYYQKREVLKAYAVARDVDIKFTADNIFIEGYLDDLKRIRELINAELHTITGILI